MSLSLMRWTMHPPARGCLASLPNLGRQESNADMGDAQGIDSKVRATLAQVPSRLRALRDHRGLTLAELAGLTGISKSTLSRLEGGQRRPTLELLLLLAMVYNVPLDDLVGAPEVGDPRIRLRPRSRNGRTVVPLSRQPGGVQAWKVVIPASRAEPELKRHEGYEWLYVLSGRMRVLIGEHDVLLGPGEVAEFDTRVPHWFGSTGDGPVEALSVFGPQGERMHHRAAPHSLRGRGVGG
jgi:transcriptional regulator with XRE-family HTH domain